MRVTLHVPAGWSSHRAGDVVTVQRGAFGSRVRGTLVGKGVDPRVLIEAERPPGSRVDYVQALDTLHARAGWRMKLVTAVIVDAADRRIETRIAAVYEMTHYLGVAVGTLIGQDDRAAILDILASAHVHLWPDEAVCIAELWSMEQP